MADVFLSYSRQDTAAARRIKDRLVGLGLSVFFDTEGLDSGDVFPDVLDREVKTAGAVVGVWSTHALSRPWVKIECDIGRARGVLVPVQIEQIAELDKPAAFWNVQFDDLSDYDGDPGHAGWRKFVRSLSRTLNRPALLEAAGIVGASPGTAGSPPPPAPPRQPAAPESQPGVTPEAVALWNSDMKYTENVAALRRFMGMDGVHHTPLEHRVRERIERLEAKEARRNRRRGSNQSGTSGQQTQETSPFDRRLPPTRLPRVAALIIVAIAANLGVTLIWLLSAPTLFEGISSRGLSMAQMSVVITAASSLNGLIFTTIGAVAGVWLHMRPGMAWASALSIGGLAVLVLAGFLFLGFSSGQGLTLANALTSFVASLVNIAVVTGVAGLIANALFRRMAS
ncbi:MAG: toll/interleukin-1 receptor domain-containing protein [Pseudomonadota bacterium]